MSDGGRSHIRARKASFRSNHTPMNRLRSLPYSQLAHSRRISTRTMAPAIALIGLPWDSPLLPPGTDGEMIKAGVARTTSIFEKAGYDLTVLWASPENGKSLLTTALKEKEYKAVIIGYGVRGTPSLTEFFEELVNTVVEVSPKTKLGFNSSPHDSFAAAKRVAPLE